MGRATKKNRRAAAPKASVPPKASIQELNDSRNDGQNSLRGYSYQFLYSCYLILSSSSPDVSFQLEGIEDIDCIREKEGAGDVTHIQLKQSMNKQDASFLEKVLKNFLEAYLLDQNRSFKLVYDFAVARGNLSKLFESNLDDASRNYWIGVISAIRQGNPSWNWAAYDFDDFISRLSFERVEMATLADEIEKALIEVYEITTDNIALFANSLKILCFEKMVQRAYVTREEVDRRIQSVKMDISKGPQNPAHSWIRKLDYSKPGCDGSRSFYEGKKATPADIASELPIVRPALENEVIQSIHENTVTVIKASSGQGKTTLALRAAYILQNEYKPYQLLCCDEIKEMGNIVQYFRARIQLGEKILILIDNLDNHLCKWNYLAQLLQSELHCHYKLLITSREIDWYNYSGDLSNVQSLNVIKPVLEKKEAEAIFNMFKKADRLHPSITSWLGAWNRIAERQLLIEYVYLLTHGEMLSERIASQISEIGQTPSGKAKCEILRKVCFADICGIRLAIVKLLGSQSEDRGWDFDELLKSMENEFLVHVNAESGYVEGLHPIRSKYVVERLHRFLPIDNTAVSVVEIARREDLPVLFSHLPEFDLDRDEFFGSVVERLWDEKDLSNYISAIKGLFSGSVMQYYLSHRAAFDEANAIGGLFHLSTEMCPFTTFKEFDISLSPLDQMREIFPNNANAEHLCELRDRIPACNLQETFVYAFCERLYRKLLQFNFSEVKDIASYAAIAEWIYSIDAAFNLAVNISLDHIWQEPEKLSLDCISTLMYSSFCGNRDEYLRFVENNYNRILSYLKHQTRSHRLYIDKDRGAIHVEYILRLRDIKAANEESVSRLKLICKTMPVFDLYCADALKPAVDFLSAYNAPDDAHKEMPIENLVIMFHQDLTSLWNKTILSNYECDTVTEWLEYWFDVRERICSLAGKSCDCIYKRLSGKSLGSLAREVNRLREDVNHIILTEKRYPKEDRPFEEKLAVPQGFARIKGQYFDSMRNFANQFPGFVYRDEQNERLAMSNLTMAHSALATMQDYFAGIADDFGFQKRHLDLCTMEKQNLERLIMCCDYYRVHSEDQYFKNYQVKKWYEQRCRNERKMVEEGLSQLQSKYSIHFPEQVYTVELLRYYPIVVDRFAATAEDGLAEWLEGCISFADSPYDYLVILCTNESGEINPVALQFPRRKLVDAKKAIESEDYDLLRNLMTPYPVDVTAQMLGCFAEKYELPDRSSIDANALPIEDVAEELWIYSKLVELLTEPEDAGYLAPQIQDIQTSITGMLRLLREKLPPEDIDWLADICSGVFSGERFDDALFNEVIERFALGNAGTGA